jgi:hypothetical protein
MSEDARIQFLIDRDGIEAAKEFARRTMRTYRTCVLQNGRNGRPFHFASYGEWKPRFIRSYLAFKAMLQAAKGER